MNSSDVGFVVDIAATPTHVVNWVILDNSGSRTNIISGGTQSQLICETLFDEWVVAWREGNRAYFCLESNLICSFQMGIYYREYLTFIRKQKQTSLYRWRRFW